MSPNKKITSSGVKAGYSSSLAEDLTRTNLLLRSIVENMNTVYVRVKENRIIQNNSQLSN